MNAKAKPAKPTAITAVEVLPPESSAQMVDVTAAFAPARAYVAEIVQLGRRANHLSVLLGHELNRVKKELGERRGGNRSKQSTQPANFAPWEQMVVKETGLSYDTCNRCMKLAEAGKKFIPLLGAEDVISTPFLQLPEARQKEVTKAIQKVVDLQTMTQLMLDFGVAKPKKSNMPPKGGKSAKNEFKGGAANRDQEESDGASYESRQILARDEHLNGEAGVIAMRDGEAWRCLEDADLAALDNALDLWRTAIAAEANTRKTEAEKARPNKKGPKV